MKRKELIRRLEAGGCILLRHGTRHDLFLNPAKRLKQPVPRHTEINEVLAHHILKRLGLEEKE